MQSTVRSGKRKMEFSRAQRDEQMNAGGRMACQSVHANIPLVNY